MSFYKVNSTIVPGATHQKQDTVSFGYELTNGNLISMVSNNPRPNFESFKMRQPIFGGSECDKSVGEDEDDTPKIEISKRNSLKDHNVVKRLGFAQSFDERISYDSSIDHENRESVKPRGEIVMNMPQTVYREDIPYNRHQLESLQQDSMKFNPMNTHNYESKAPSIEISRADSKNKKEPADVQKIGVQFTHAKSRPSIEVFGEQNKYFIKKNREPVLKENLMPMFDESTHRQVIANPPMTEKAIEATKFSAYYERSKDESDPERTREKIMKANQVNKLNPMASSRIHKTEDTFEDPTTRNFFFNPRTDQGQLIEREGPMFTSNYISNPFKDTQSDLTTRFQQPHMPRENFPQITQSTYRTDGSSMPSSMQRSYHIDTSKLIGYRKQESAARLDNTEDYHSFSQMSSSQQCLTPKPRLMQEDALKHRKAPSSIYKGSLNSRTPTSTSGMRSLFASKPDKHKTRTPKSSQGPQGLTRKDVLEILKLHTALQAKIQYLEGKVSPNLN